MPASDPQPDRVKFVYPRLKTRRIKSPAELDEGITWALKEKGPVLVDVWVDKAEDVLPMVRPGQRLSDMIES
jgi:acetolactate synthase-1/2/3 large subunit